MTQRGGPDFFVSNVADTAGGGGGMEAGMKSAGGGQMLPGFGFDPTTAAVGQQLFQAGSSMVNERIGRGWAMLDSLRYYFSVNNSYVKNKLKLLFFPFLHRNWQRLMVSQGDGDAYRAPRDDINAPDLYIPAMGFLTWMMLWALLLGQEGKFSPEAFGAFASKGFAVVVLEVLLLKAGYYLLSDAPSPNTLVLAAWSSYKFPGICVNLLAYLALGLSGYYLALAYNALCMAFFLRDVMRVSWLSSASPTAGKYFRLVVMLTQFVYPFLLG